MSKSKDQAMKAIEKNIIMMMNFDKGKFVI